VIAREHLAGAIGCCVALSVALAGCSSAPQAAGVREHAAAVFDDLVEELETVDVAQLRTVEILPEERRPCAEGEGEQASLLARGTVSVGADEAAVARILDNAAARLDAAQWQTDGAAGERTWASDDGIVVTLVDASPVLLLAVFPPCGV
jgi:hypothetical protein